MYFVSFDLQISPHTLSPAASLRARPQPPTHASCTNVRLLTISVPVRELVLVAELALVVTANSAGTTTPAP